MKDKRMKTYTIRCGTFHATLRRRPKECVAFRGTGMRECWRGVVNGCLLFEECKVAVVVEGA